MTFEVPKADAYGGVLFDLRGRTLLRKPTGHFGGYVWTFPKGKPDANESPEATALREVLEETGYQCRVVGGIAQVFLGTTSNTAFFLMEPLGPQGDFGNETTQTRWATFAEARDLIGLTTPATGRKRDLAILDAAEDAIQQLAQAAPPIKI